MKKARMRKASVALVALLVVVMAMAAATLGAAAAGSSTVRGDMNNDGKVGVEDAIFLLRHYFAPNKYVISQSGDVNGDGVVNASDAIYLLRHVFASSKYPLACGHDEMVVDPEVLPTCTKSGLSEGSHCSLCNAVVKTQEEISALGHDYVDGVCTRCGDEEIGYVPEHTCVGEEWVTVKQPTCTEDGEEELICSCGSIMDTNTLPATGHAEVTDDAKAATCTATGLTAGSHCSVCGETLIEQTVVPALEHELGEWTQTQAPTCTEKGEEKRTCANCEHYETREVSALGHDYVNDVCTRCGDKLLKASEGLAFTLNSDGESYSVSGTGKCTDTDIVIPSTYEGKPVTSIGYGAFKYDHRLTSITIPDSVTSIDEWALSGCTNIESITVGSGNAVYHSAGNCLIETASKTLVAGFKNSIIPTDGSVTSIGNAAFYCCSVLTSITIPDNITSIGIQAFESTGLTSITIPSSVTNLGVRAFTCCKALTDITIPDSVTSISGQLFYECSGLTSIKLPDSITSIDNWAFNSCTGLTNITIPNNVTSIGDSAFLDCKSLTSITIPDSVTSIGDSAFKYCTGLTSITIGNGVTSIGSYAFSGCSGLTGITIPDGVTSIGNYAFSGCSNLESITVGSGNTVYHSAGNCLIETASKTLISGFKNSVIPSDGSVTIIGDSAFSGCSGLTSITIPDGVTSIGNHAFSGCSGLTSITIPDSVTFIGSYAFYGCSGLTSITIPNGVTGIGDGAFRNCSDLTSIIIFGGVTSIKFETFRGCSNLKSITIPDSVTCIEKNAFERCTKLKSIVYKGTKSQWKAIDKVNRWNISTGSFTVYCTDGNISKSNS